jgi:phage terminase Nu1 subunit (DNA packaging protein)
MEETNVPTKFLVDRREAARIAGVSERTISRWAAHDRLDVYRGGEHDRWVRYDSRQVVKVSAGLDAPFRRVVKETPA